MKFPVRIISNKPLKRLLSTTSLDANSSRIKDLRLSTKIKTILIIKKKMNAQTNQAEIDLFKHLKENYNEMNIILEDDKSRKIPKSEYYIADDIAEYERVVDLVITLGGDGTLLHASSLFPRKVAPILSFSMGSLGFLLPFSNLYRLKS